MRLLLRCSTALWRRGVPQRVAAAVFEFPQREEFPREQPVWFLLRQYSTGTQSTSGFIAAGVFYRLAEHHVGVDPLLSCTFYFLQNKIEYRWSKNCSVGNPPPRGNPGLKRTRTDTILKKFY
jgi:hypothetical protein